MTSFIRFCLYFAATWIFLYVAIFVQPPVDGRSIVDMEFWFNWPLWKEFLSRTWGIYLVDIVVLHLLIDQPRLKRQEATKRTQDEHQIDTDWWG